MTVERGQPSKTRTVNVSFSVGMLLHETTQLSWHRAAVAASRAPPCGGCKVVFQPVQFCSGSSLEGANHGYRQEVTVPVVGNSFELPCIVLNMEPHRQPKDRNVGFGFPHTVFCTTAPVDCSPSQPPVWAVVALGDKPLPCFGTMVNLATGKLWEFFVDGFWLTIENHLEKCGSGL